MPTRKEGKSLPHSYCVCSLSDLINTYLIKESDMLRVSLASPSCKCFILAQNCWEGFDTEGCKLGSVTPQ